MAFKVIKIQNSTDPSDEYVLLEASGNTNNLDGYAIVDKTFTNSGKVSNKFRHIFRFPAKVSRRGELVSLRKVLVSLKLSKMIVAQRSIAFTGIQLNVFGMIPVTKQF